MTTNLLFSYCDIPYNATAAASPTGATGYGATNLITGARSEHFRASSAGTTTTYDFDLGLGVTQAPDHVIIARADMLRKGDSTATTWYVQGDDNSSFSSPQSSTGTFNTTDLKGPRSEDFVSALTRTAERYWRVQLVTTTSFKHQFSKIYLGNWLDLGHDPRYQAAQERLVLANGNREPRYTVYLEYEGITDAKTQALNSYILAKRDVNPIFLYDTNDYLLNDCRLLHCVVAECSITPRTVNRNSITMTLEELI